MSQLHKLDKGRMMVSPQEYERQIQEQRLKEAEEKGYLGQSGKIAIILRNLGCPIISDSPGGALVDTHYLEDPYDLQEAIEDSDTAEDVRDRMPMQQMLNPDGSDPTPGGDGEFEDWRKNPKTVHYDPNTIGYNFDGLSRGMHMEIRYMEDTNVFFVSYKGFEVYKEIKGELVSYVPIPEWEGWIERLFRVAKPLEFKKQTELMEEEEQEMQTDKASWVNSLRKRWGI